MIILDGVSKVYRTEAGEVAALKDISLHIRKGDFVAVMGPSGSGKSTLMNIIGCLDKPTAGRYVLDGEEVGALQGSQMARIRNRKIGFVHQKFNLLPRLTALENVELPLVYGGVGGRERMGRAKAALAQTGLSDREDFYPNQLSGGQQQRVAIARALVTGAPVILADEPTGNLDSKTSVEILTIFERLNERGATILMVTHEPDVAEWCRSVIHVKDGQLGGGA